MEAIVDKIVHLMEVLGAPGVGIAILLENLFPPIPSEVVLPLAGFTVSQGSLSFVATFIWATIGSVVGALALYGVGAAVGAERLRRIADWMWLVEPSDVDKALHWFDKYGPASVFFGRFIPGVRSLISIPAGIDRMPIWKFSLWTTLGSAGWNLLLIALGVWLGESYTLVEKYVGEYSNVVYVIIALILVAAFVWLLLRARRRKAATEDAKRNADRARAQARQSGGRHHRDPH
ncbi:DedA family protein [Corynebacterium uterequi]|uniref:Putative membrane-associated protein n=1 Tax=Corynebacterium uterequi TaxID=1072256 RepID=A0A0G3HBB5_9CORY|nr:DedA family protein [Corynebacterium uterequi]AKK10676.1 putative membrane-associated protein [Corynebacterium uterequi]